MCTTSPPQFLRTHVNFQRVPTVDTSNPFIARDIPTPDESFVVIHFNHEVEQKAWISLPAQHDSRLFHVSLLTPSWCPAAKWASMEVILTPMIHDLVAKKKKAK